MGLEAPLPWFVGGPTVSLECPLCASCMSPVRAGPLTIDKCAHCSVLWFDERELDGFLQLPGLDRPGRTPETARVAPPSVPKRCPRCGMVSLYPGAWKGVPMMHCVGCCGVLVGPTALEQVRQLYLCARSRDPTQSGSNATLRIGIEEEVLSLILEVIAGPHR